MCLSPAVVPLAALRSEVHLGANIFVSMRNVVFLLLIKLIVPEAARAKNNFGSGVSSRTYMLPSNHVMYFQSGTALLTVIYIQE